MAAFAEALRNALTPLVRGLLHHPFVLAVEAETLPREALCRFAAQDLLVVEAAGRAFAAAAATSPGREDHLRFLHMGAHEVEDRQRLVALGLALGVSEADLAEAEPLPGCAALAHFLYWLCAFGPAAQRAAAFAAIQGAFSAMARRIAAGLRSQYGLGAEAVALFARHAERAPEDPLAGVESLAALAGDEPTRRAILAGARQALGFETMFFDAVVAGEAAGGDARPEWVAAGSGEAFAERLQAECLPLRRACLDHPFVRGVETGTLPAARLRLFAQQAFWLLRETYRLGGLALARTPDLRTQEVILEKLHGELGHWKLMLAFARALGAADSEVESAEPLPGTMALTNFFYWVTAPGAPGERAAAIGASEGVFAPICARLARGFAAHYGLTPEAIRFFAVHATAEIQHEAVATRILAAHARTPESRPAIRRAAHLAYRYERLFFDTVLAAR